MLLRRLLGVAALLWPAAAMAERDLTRDALVRAEELLTIRIDDGNFDPNEVVPAIVVSVTPAYEESQTWYPTAALGTLIRVFGSSGLRVCEACMAPRTFVEEGHLEQTAGTLPTSEITRLDEGVRGTALPARTAIWLDESASGVSLRIVNLSNSRVVLAENVDPMLSEMTRTQRNLSLARELERRARGDSITQLFFDAALYPGQHISTDWTEQWGDTNNNLSGVTLSFLDPLIGLGGVYYRIIPDAMNIAVGGKLIVSLPNALAKSFTGESPDILGDRMLNGVFITRIPIGSSNYGAVFSASSNGRIGIGISFLNTSLLPFIL